MIKIFVMDVDGTLTDGKINISDNGELFKSFNTKDGIGIKLLQENNIIPVIITGRKSKITENRAKELNIKYLCQNISNKLECLNGIIKELNITYDEVAYIGDDINDLDCIKKVLVSFCPNDAVFEVKNNVKYICKLNAGEGAVREAIDNILKFNRG